MSAAPDSGFVTRFSRWAILQHALMIVVFVVLLVTGLPQKLPYFDASRWLILHMDRSIFTGQISVERMRHEHPLELEELERRGASPARPTPTA